ncbi:unnamed protein product [Dibothriocephalus latus]|uniref:Uncharacterized protein n=1 Tax=Dibothriocephalus latus TaxID=60516 RepID=A0A3P7LWH2_DIBLA|nr:unnamed protein product [Dibothriocephalus latus]
MAPSWYAETTEPEEPVEKPAEPPVKGGLYVPVYLRAGGAKVINRQAQPDIESIEEFPTLDAVQEKPKKTKPPKAEADDSWNEVSKTSQGHRADASSHAYTPPVFRQGAELKPFKPSSSSKYSENLEQRYGGGGVAGRDSFQLSTQSWVRGAALPASSQPSTEQTRSSGWVRGIPQSQLTVKPIQRNLTDLPQENRFARLGDT